MSRKCQQLKITIIKSFHVLMKNDFTSGKKKKRTALPCVFNRIVSQWQRKTEHLAAMKRDELP